MFIFHYFNQLQRTLALNEFKNFILIASKILRNIMFEIFWSFSTGTQVKCHSTFSEVYCILGYFVIVYLCNCVALLKHLKLIL